MFRQINGVCVGAQEILQNVVFSHSSVSGVLAAVVTATEGSHSGASGVLAAVVTATEGSYSGVSGVLAAVVTATDG